MIRASIIDTTKYFQYEPVLTYYGGLGESPTTVEWQEFVFLCIKVYSVIFDSGSVPKSCRSPARPTPPAPPTHALIHTNEFVRTSSNYLYERVHTNEFTRLFIRTSSNFQWHAPRGMGRCRDRNWSRALAKTVSYAVNLHDLRCKSKRFYLRMLVYLVICDSG